MVGLVPTIQPTTIAGARRGLDPRDKPEDDAWEDRVSDPPVSWSGLSRPSSQPQPPEPRRGLDPRDPRPAPRAGKPEDDTLGRTQRQLTDVMVGLVPTIQPTTIAGAQTRAGSSGPSACAKGRQARGWHLGENSASTNRCHGRACPDHPASHNRRSPDELDPRDPRRAPRQASPRMALGHGSRRTSPLGLPGRAGKREEPAKAVGIRPPILGRARSRIAAAQPRLPGTQVEGSASAVITGADRPSGRGRRRAAAR